MNEHDITCEAVEDALIARALGNAHHEHVATCATCQGMIKMTGSIETELAEVPVQVGQVPHWISELHARGTRRRKRLLWSGGLLATAAAATAIVVMVASSDAPRAQQQQVASAPLPPAPITQAPPVTHAPPPAGGMTVAPKSDFGRPDWVATNETFAAYCTTTGPIYCVGVSSYRSSRSEAKQEAEEAAFDALMTAVADRIQNKFFKDYIRPAYEAKRHKLIHDYNVGADNRTVPATDEAYRHLASARHRAYEAMLGPAAAPVPDFNNDWYWEQYDNDDGKGSSFLGFVKYTISDAQLAKLASTYEGESGKGVMAAFPLLAYAFDDFSGGLIDIGAVLAGSTLQSAILHDSH